MEITVTNAILEPVCLGIVYGLTGGWLLMQLAALAERLLNFCRRVAQARRRSNHHPAPTLRSAVWHLARSGSAPGIHSARASRV